MACKKHYTPKGTCVCKKHYTHQKGTCIEHKDEKELKKLKDCVILQTLPQSFEQLESKTEFTNAFTTNRPGWIEYLKNKGLSLYF